MNRPMNKSFDTCVWKWGIKVQVAICAMTDNEIKSRVEKELLKAQISYLLKCEKQKYREEQINKNLGKVTFYIESNQKAKAMEIVARIKSNSSEDFEVLL